MKLIKDVIIGLIAIVALVFGVFVAWHASDPVAPEKLGAVPGSEYTELQTYRSDVVVGGNNFATSSQGATTYTAAQIMFDKTITHTATGALTVTLPASSTMSGYMPRVGDTKSVVILPVTNGITLAGGTGTSLYTASSTKFCVAGQVCRLELIRKSNTDISVLMTSASGN